MHTSPGAAAGTGRDEERLVRDHLPLVQYAVSEVMARVPRHVTRDDLTSAGLLGLAQAARSWDPDRGVTFDRFARTRIRGALLDELRGRDWASRSVRARARQVASVSDELTADLGRPPTSEEVGARTGLKPGDVARLQHDVHRATVLNYETVFLAPDQHPGLALEEQGPAEVLQEREVHAYLRDAIVALPERLRRVVVGYFFEERPMHELAAELGVTESRISQMRAEALVLLRDGMDSQLEPEAYANAETPSKRVARRKAAYVSAVASASDYRSRLASSPEPVLERVAKLVAAS